jgi:hypothetical protein
MGSKLSLDKMARKQFVKFFTILNIGRPEDERHSSKAAIRIAYQNAAVGD